MDKYKNQIGNSFLNIILNIVGFILDHILIIKNKILKRLYSNKFLIIISTIYKIWVIKSKSEMQEFW